MPAKLVTPTWSTWSLNKDINGHKYIFLNSPFSDQKSLTPCFHHSKLKVDKERGSNLFSSFQQLQSKFPLGSTMADGSKNSINNITLFQAFPDTWFVHMEAQLDIRIIIISSTKFYGCISALPCNVSAQLTCLIQDPGEDPYQDIKDPLIHLYSLSNYQKFEALINLPFTRDTTPSVFISSMLNLYPKKFKPDFLFIGLFLCQLPQSIWDHLLALVPDALAKKADQLFQSHQSSSLTFLPVTLQSQFT